MGYSILKFPNRHIMSMKTKKDIVEDWLPRYTGRALEDFSKHIILTNFDYYLDLFAEKYNAPIIGENKNMPNVSHDGITMINFGMGSANAATVLDLLSAIEPEAVLFIGKCGGLKAKHHEGDYILPIAAIKGEGTSNDYMPKEVPSLPSFSVQKACSKIITNHDRQYYTGVVRYHNAQYHRMRSQLAISRYSEYLLPPYMPCTALAHLLPEARVFPKDNKISPDSF